MATNLFSLCCILLVCSCLYGQRGSHAVSLSISPEKAMSLLDRTVLISCKLDDTDHNKEITMMEISRNNLPPIAYLRDCTNLTFGNNQANQFTGEGHIATNGGKSFMTLTLLRPMSQDSGVYTCVLHHVTKDGILKEEKISKTLTVGRLDMVTLENVLNDLRDKLDVNEKELEESNTDQTALRNELNDLKDKLATTEQNAKELSEKLGHVSAFSATNLNSHITSVSGNVLTFPDVTLRRGPRGYDEKTGVFTAPTSGLYVFHLAVFQYNCYFDVQLTLNNDKVLGKLRAYDTDWDQSEISCVVELVPGDKVKPIMLDSGCSIHFGGYSFFNGYLITKDI